MATTGWHTDRSLSEILARQFRQFDPLQLVRLWLRLSDRDGGPQADSGLRFRAELGAGFPGCPISRVEVESIGPVVDAAEAAHSEREQLCISTADFCIGSALGPLPEPYLEWVREQESAGHTATRDFLDLFNHRINLLRWRMRAEFEPGLNNLPPEQTALADQIAALMGLSDASGRLELHVPRRSWLGIGGLLSGARRSAPGLRQVLAAHLGCPVSVEPLVGTWRDIEPQDQQRLGLGERRLGQDSLLGSRVWDTERRVRLHIGPLDFAQARALLPPRAWRSALLLVTEPPEPVRAEGEGSLYAALTSLVGLMLGHHLDAEVSISVRSHTVPPSRVVSRPGHVPWRHPQAGLRLGQTAWLQRRTEPGARTLRFLLHAHAAGQA